MATDDALSVAIRLIKAGKRPEAQLVLEPFIQANPQNIQAWMWEAEIFLDDRDKVKVMEICLEHNPDHPQVIKALTILKTRLGLPLDKPAFISPPAPAPVISENTRPKHPVQTYSPQPAPTPKPAAEIPLPKQQTPKPAIRRKHPDWPTTEGVVQVSEIRETRTGYTPVYMADISAMYIVNNKDYTVKYPRGKASITPYDAQILVSNFPPGKGVTVSYHPKNPRRAWVDEWDNRTLQAFKARPEIQSQLVQRYKSRMWSGCGWLVGGIAATVIGTMVMSQYGYAYIAFTGAIVYGLIQFVSGLFGWLWNMD